MDTFVGYIFKDIFFIVRCASSASDGIQRGAICGKSNIVWLKLVANNSFWNKENCKFKNEISFFRPSAEPFYEGHCAA